MLSAGLSCLLGEGDLERKEREEGEAGSELGCEGGAETASMSQMGFAVVVVVVDVVDCECSKRKDGQRVEKMEERGGDAAGGDVLECNARAETENALPGRSPRCEAISPRSLSPFRRSSSSASASSASLRSR